MEEIQFLLTSDYIPLCDLLKVTGVISSGGLAKVMISEGEVCVDDHVELRKTYKVRAGQTVQVNNTRIVVTN